MSSQELVVATGAPESERSAILRHILKLASQLKSKTQRNCKKNTMCLLDMPLDVIREIWDHLHPINSVCLSLTCKALYPIHMSLHPKVPLLTTTVTHIWSRWAAPFSKRRKHMLAGLLIEWASPLIWSLEEAKKDGKWYIKGSHFMTKELHRELRAQGKKRYRFRI